MFEPFEVLIKNWLNEDPNLSAASVLQSLSEIDPSRFTQKNLRMMQRLVCGFRINGTAIPVNPGQSFH